MSSILDIDLDYFNLMRHPGQELEKLLGWAGRSVDFVVHRHHHALVRWKAQVHCRALGSPTHILHVDEHHDMMDERKNSNLGNFIYQAMCTWPKCRVHWLVENPIDSPGMWLSEEGWKLVVGRFTVGPRIPLGWPKPDLFSVCTSPEFVEERLRQQLVDVVLRSMNQKNKST